MSGEKFPNTLSRVIRIASVSQRRDGDEFGLIVNQVEDSVISDAHAVFVFGAFEFGASVWTGILLEIHYRRVCLPDDIRRQTLHLPLGGGCDFNLIRCGLESEGLAKRTGGHSLARFS